MTCFPRTTSLPAGARGGEGGEGGERGRGKKKDSTLPKDQSKNSKDASGAARAKTTESGGYPHHSAAQRALVSAD